MSHCHQASTDAAHGVGMSASHDESREREVMTRLSTETVESAFVYVSAFARWGSGYG